MHQVNCKLYNYYSHRQYVNSAGILQERTIITNQWIPSCYQRLYIIHTIQVHVWMNNHTRSFTEWPVGSHTHFWTLSTTDQPAHQKWPLHHKIMWRWCNVMSLHCDHPFEIQQSPGNPLPKWPSEVGWWWQWTPWPQTCPSLIYCRRRQVRVVQQISNNVYHIIPVTCTVEPV